MKNAASSGIHLIKPFYLMNFLKFLGLCSASVLQIGTLGVYLYTCSYFPMDPDQFNAANFILDRALPLALLVYWIISEIIKPMNFSGRRLIPVSMFSLLSAIVLRLFLPRLPLIHHALPILFFILLFFLAYNLIVILLLKTKDQRSSYCLPSVFTVFLSLLVFALLPVWPNTDLIGDEPYFLLISHSLLHDYDVNLENNYLNCDSKFFSDRCLKPQLWDSYQNDRLISRQPIMVPLLLLPGYWLGNRLGAILTMIFLSAILGCVFYRTLRQISAGIRIPLIMGLVSILSPPVLFYSHRLFAEIPGALFSLIALISTYHFYSGKNRFPWGAIIASLISGLIKMRFLLLTIPVLIIAIVLKKLKFHVFLRIVLVSCACGFILIVFNQLYYGSVLGRINIYHFLGTDWTRFLRGSISMFLDAQYGLFFLNPLLILIPAGLVAVHRRASKLLPLLAASIIPYFFVITGFAELIGGHCPKGRFAVALIPILLIPVSIFIARNKSIFMKMIQSACFLGLLMITSIYLTAPDLQINAPGQSDKLLTAISGFFHTDLYFLLPSFDRYDDWIRYYYLFFAVVLTVIYLPIIAHPAVKKRTADQFSAIPALLLILVFPVILTCFTKKYASPWMEFEDPSFSKQDAAVYWEEPYQWESSYNLSVPYFSGIELIGNRSATRIYNLRGSGKYIELRARAEIDQAAIPILAVTINERTSILAAINSSMYESYYLESPETLTSDSKVSFHLQDDTSSSNARVFLDKMRITDVVPESYRFFSGDTGIFPVVFKDQSVQNVQLQQKIISANDSLKFEASFEGISNPDDEICIRVRQRYAIIERCFKPQQSNPESFELEISDETGSGHYITEFAYKRSGVFLDPSPFHGFRNGHWCYAGEFDVLPSLNPITVQATQILSHTAYGITEILPYSTHLGCNSSVSIPINTTPVIQKIILISRISEVWDMISFEEVIGEIILTDTLNKTHKYQLVIGKHTAEDKYDFNLKDIKLQHSKPVIAWSEEKTLTWPPSLAGKSYLSQSYLSEIQVNDSDPITGITILYTCPFGIFDVLGIGLVSVP